MNTALASEPTPVRIRSGPARGLALVIRPKEEKYYWAGSYETAVQNALVSNLDRGDTFWDVGAHCGFFSCLASRIVGPAGQVVAFEPIEENRKRLAESLRLNSCDNTVVEPFAIAAAEGFVSLYAHGYSSMWAIDERGVPQSQREARCTTLSRAAHPTRPWPSVIKLDIEGAEASVFEESGEWLSVVRPTVIAELHGDESMKAAQSALPDYRFEQLSGRHWLLIP
jgi:FkbM family methyltransferase